MGDTRQRVNKGCPWLPNKIKDCTWQACVVNHVYIGGKNNYNVNKMFRVVLKQDNVLLHNTHNSLPGCDFVNS